MLVTKVFWLILCFWCHIISCNDIGGLNDKETKKINILADIIIANFKKNEWKNIIIFGHFPDYFYLRLKAATKLNNTFTFVTSNTDDDDYYMEDVVPYYSNTVIIKTQDFSNFEESLLKVMSLPNWHPHASLYLYYNSEESKENIARIFFILWYYRAPNAVIIQNDDIKNLLYIKQYSPFVSEVYELENKFGCWTAKKLGYPIYTFDESFVCEENCQNVSLHSYLRATSLGTCIGYNTTVVSYYEVHAIRNLWLFENKGKNLHGFPFRSFITEVLPFMRIREHPDKGPSLDSRDGIIWNTMAKLLNFSIDLSSYVRKPFDFEISIQQIFSVAHRKGDLFLMPIYQFDIIVVELDYTFAYKESGVCFASHRAGFETIIFDVNTIAENYNILIQFGISFLFIWFIFCVYDKTRLDSININFIGKTFLNSVRSVLLISITRQTKRLSFRIFLAIIVWSFFIINFLTQAAIVSYFTALKRGNDVNTFDDIVEKGYRIEGMASPDVVLPETEEKFRKINAKLSPIRDIFGCVRALKNDSQRFCLVDCSVGRYLEKNMLNDKGEQYLHIAKDRVHSYFLNFILPKHSVITEHFNKYMITFFEAGLIKKWEAYKYDDLKAEAPTKPLSTADMEGILNVYGILVAGTIIVFILEFCIGNFKRFRDFVSIKIKNWKLTRKAKQTLKVDRKLEKKYQVNNFTQT